MPDEERRAFQWVGGDPALDFNNTVSWNPDGLKEERLRSHEDLVAWAKEAGLLPRPARLLRISRRDPSRARAALARALALRKTLHEVFTALAGGRTPDARSVRDFEAYLARAFKRLRIRPRGDTFRWAFAGTDTDLLAPLWGVSWHAARLLTSLSGQILRRCANPDCGWVFLDRSRKRNRRWCDMQVCGSRAKANAYYARKRAKRS